MFGRLPGVASVAICLFVAGCGASDDALGDDGVARSEGAIRRDETGAVFTQTNEAEGNRVLSLARNTDGVLSAPVAYETGGRGISASLGSQGALVLSENHRFLLVVNAGSNDVSSFAVSGSRLQRVDRVASGGMQPVSVTEHEGRVFVLNAGSPANVVGFELDRHGRLRPLDRSMADLSNAAPGAAQVQLVRDGHALVVTEKSTNLIDVFDVHRDGTLGPRSSQMAAGKTPFGFGVADDDTLVVSEAASTTASSYSVGHQGAKLVSGPVALGQAAPCWVAVTHDNRWAFVANAGASTISSLSIGHRGQLGLLDAQAGMLPSGSQPLDLGVDDHDRHLYVIARQNRTVASFAVHGGTLDLEDQVGPLPPFASGIAVY